MFSFTTSLVSFFPPLPSLHTFVDMILWLLQVFKNFEFRNDKWKWNNAWKKKRLARFPAYFTTLFMMWISEPVKFWAEELWYLYVSIYVHHTKQWVLKMLLKTR